MRAKDAILFGADAVPIGRAFVHALATGGPCGRRAAAGHHGKDIRANMVLTGVESAQAVGAHLLAR